MLLQKPVVHDTVPIDRPCFPLTINIQELFPAPNNPTRTYRAIGQTDFETSMQAIGFSHRQKLLHCETLNLPAAAAAVHIQYVHVRQQKTCFIKPAPSRGKHLSAHLVHMKAAKDLL
jgi:hypothetical protein